MLSHQYIAGLFDGEGCIHCSKQWIKGKYEKYPRVNMQISIANTNKKVLVYLQAFYNFGSLKIHKGSGCKQCWSWRITGRFNMLKFLNSIYDYSIIKKDEIDMAIQFCNTLRTENFGCLPLNKDEHILRGEIYEKLRKRKRR